MHSADRYADALQLLGVGRSLLALVALVFALKGHYWILAAAATVGLVVSILIAVGVAPIVTAALAYGLYLGIALHALDVSRRVHPNRRRPR
jgi:hypothetical protein